MAGHPSQFAQITFELEKERHSSMGFKQKVADLGDQNTKLQLKASKQQAEVENVRKEMLKLETKWQNKYDKIAREWVALRKAAKGGEKAEEAPREPRPPHELPGSGRRRERKQAGQLGSGRRASIAPIAQRAAPRAGLAQLDASKMASATKAMAQQRDRADNLQLALKQCMLQVSQEQQARAKADKLVHELWAKLNEVEKDAKAAAAKMSQERVAMRVDMTKMQQEMDGLRIAETGRQKQVSVAHLCRSTVTCL
jgi:hypothetical protein